MKVELISVTPDAERLMAYITRVSSSMQDNAEYAKLLRFCIDHGHWSVFEHGAMTVEIHTTRMISPQILRHWSFRFQEFSQRYAAVDESGVEIYMARRQAKKNRQSSVDDISDFVRIEWDDRQKRNWKQSFEHYQWALDNGIATECARAVLPLQTVTKMYMTGNVRSWIHYIQLRTPENVQKEHRDIAEAIKQIFINEFPVVSDALGWKAD